jgi:bifunctional DNA-binding transcriptional regulator/antitoxin component of YhaV-PrlF toxin-antitoxin module
MLGYIMYVSTLKLSSRGQIVLPKKVREALNSNYVTIHINDSKATIAAAPDVEGALSEYAKNGDPSLSWDEVRQISWERSLSPKYLGKKIGNKI